ncbi:hypothetical protein AX16_007623 [Volvariella volvacea WC 439]|nr:hypothetical protein AX16_007623 [Volvariella volvacea WC 439]
MSLRTGLYTIRNHDHSVAHRHEPDLMPPRPVIMLPPGVRPPNWLLEKLDNDSYFIKTTDDGPLGTADIDKKVFAVLGGGEAWRIVHAEDHGPHSYRIRKLDNSAGWIAPKPYEQVICDQLFGANDVFEIYPVPLE